MIATALLSNGATGEQGTRTLYVCNVPTPFQCSLSTEMIIWSKGRFCPMYGDIIAVY